MNGTLGACGCCDTPPPTGGGGDPDPSWTKDYYWAAKQAQIRRDGFPDLRSYYRAINYDTGIRYAKWQETVTDPAGNVLMRDRREFFIGAERLGTRGQFPVFEPYYGAGYNPLDTRNTVLCNIVAAPSWGGNQFAFWRSNSPADAPDHATIGIFGGTVTSIASQEVPETLLAGIDDKLAFGQFKGGRIQFVLQDNPRDVVATSVLDGTLSGVEWRCTTVPALPSYYTQAQFLGNPQNLLHSFDVATWSKGTILDNRDPYTGLKLQRDKRLLQLGFKSPVPSDPVVKSYHKFSVPEGYNLLGGRGVAEALQVNGLKLPANSEWLASGDVSLAVGSLVNVAVAEQEVWVFDGRPFPFPVPLPSADDLIRPLAAKARLWIVFPAIYSRFPPYVITSPFTVAVRWTHEDRCLKHDVYRSTDGGAEVLVGTIDANPEEWPSSRGVGIPGWHGYADPDGPGTQFPLGYDWTYSDTATEPGHTYTYRVKSWYYEGIKSAFSHAYQVTT